MVIFHDFCLASSRTPPAMARAPAPVVPPAAGDAALAPQPCVVLLRSALTGEDLGSFRLEQRTTLRQEILLGIGQIQVTIY